MAHTERIQAGNIQAGLCRPRRTAASKCTTPAAQRPCLPEALVSLTAPVHFGQLTSIALPHDWYSNSPHARQDKTSKLRFMIRAILADALVSDQPPPGLLP